MKGLAENALDAAVNIPIAIATTNRHIIKHIAFFQLYLSVLVILADKSTRKQQVAKHVRFICSFLQSSYSNCAVCGSVLIKT